MNFFWSGFYFVHKKELQLSIFQGTTACSKIGYNKGVCGKAWATKKIIIVDDVEQFEGHIACSSLSKSEIVLPIRNTNGEVVGVLDVDSDQLDDFSETDHKWLIEVVAVIESVL